MSQTNIRAHIIKVTVCWLKAGFTVEMLQK